MFQVSVLLSDLIRDILGALLQSGCCTARADGRHMMRLADLRLLSPVGVHAGTGVLYLGTEHVSEITVNIVRVAYAAERAAFADAEEAPCWSAGSLFLCH